MRPSWHQSVTALTLFSAVSSAGADTLDESATAEEIAALKHRLSDLEAKQKTAWTRNSDSEEIRALIQGVAADSANRTSLLDEGATGGYMGPGKGFTLQSADGGFSMRIGLQYQFRYVWNNRDGNGNPAVDENVAGFEVRRNKIRMSGNLFDKELKYNILGAFNRSGGAFALEDAYFDWTMGEGWTFRWGQFKAPFNREELLSDVNQLTAERSYVNSLVTLDRTQGVQLGYDAEKFKVQASFNEGYTPSFTGPGTNASNTAFNATPTEWAFTARGEWLVTGDWKQFDDATSWLESPTGLLLGAAVHWQDAQYGSNANNNEQEVLQWTVDAALELSGPELSAWVVGRHNDPNSPSSPSFDQLGFVAQGSFNIDNTIEPYVRYEWFDFDNAIAGNDQFSAVTVGFNYFLNKNGWRWTTDVIYCLDPVPAASTGVGLVADSAGQDGQVALRTQMQITF